MKFFCCIIGLMLLASGVLAADDWEDVVYLKDGGIIRGLIIEQVPGKSIKLQTVGGSVFVYQYDQIERMTREPLISQRPGRSGEARMSGGSGYLGLSRTGLAIGEDEVLFSVAGVNAIQLSPYFSLGIGLAYDNYPNGGMLPIYLDLRAYMIDGPVTPYFFADIGYAIGWVDESWADGDFGGLYASLGAGIRFNTSHSMAILFDIGYKRQASKEVGYVYYGDSFYYYEDDVNYDFVTLQLGLAFTP